MLIFVRKTIMSNTITFDTLAYAKRLIAVGVPAKQAEVQAEIFAEIINEQIATKRDLKEMEMRITIRLGAMMAASIAIVATLVKLL